MNIIEKLLIGGGVVAVLIGHAGFALLMGCAIIVWFSAQATHLK